MISGPGQEGWEVGVGVRTQASSDVRIKRKCLCRMRESKAIQKEKNDKGRIEPTRNDFLLYYLTQSFLELEVLLEVLS